MTTAKKATRQRYARLMGDFWRHPRTANLSPVAAGILCRAWSYCADQMTDGEVPRFIVAAFFGGNPDEAVVRELVEAGLWEEASAGYRMRDWAERNITKAAWEERKAKARDRVQRYREREAANGNASRNALHEPLPTRYERHGNASGNGHVTHPETHDEGRRTKDEDHPLRDDVVKRAGEGSSSTAWPSPVAVTDLGGAISRLRQMLDAAAMRIRCTPLNGDHGAVREAATWTWQVVGGDAEAWVKLTEAMVGRWERDPYLRNNRVGSLAKNYLSRLATLHDEVTGRASPGAAVVPVAQVSELERLRAELDALEPARNEATIAGPRGLKRLKQIEAQQNAIRKQIQALKSATGAQQRRAS